MNKLVKTIPSADLIPEFLNTLNGILDLTNRELDALIEIIKINSNNPKNENVVSADIRKQICKNTGLTLDNLARYVVRFKKKGILVSGKSDGSILLNKAIVPEIIGDRVQITIVLKLDDEKQNEE